MGNIPCCEEKKQQKGPEVIPNINCPTKTKLESLRSHQEPNTPDYQHKQPSVRETKKTVKQQGNMRGPQKYTSKKYLGRGAFGCVCLAQQNETGKLYAIKIIQKGKIKQFNLMQCQLIKQIGHPQFLTNIRETFQNQTHIYIIMQYLPMGDLYFYLRKKEIPFNQPIIRGVLAEIVVAIGILHNYGLVYRQLKPQNLLITKQGHIKLTDYGLSKIIVEEKQFISTFNGTIEYMAPQALQGNFGQKADIWSLGILMFQLMFRQSPFEGNQRQIDTPTEVYKKCIQSNLINQQINARIGYMSSNFRDLILKLLQKNPQRRIGLQQIRGHDFFKEVKWRQVQQRKNEAPLIDIIQKHDFINYRDATNEEYIRKAVTKHNALIDNYEFKLYQFINSH